MTTYWIGSDKDYSDALIKYAKRLGYRIPEDASLIASFDDGGNMAGFGALAATQEVADILFLYVPEENRGKGIGGELLAEMENMAGQVGVSGLRCYVPHDTATLVFFAKKGYEFYEGPREYAVPYGALKYSEVYRKNISGKTPKKAKSLERCSDKEKKILKAYLETNGITGTESFDIQLSAVIFEGQEVITILLGETNMKGVIVSFMRSDKEHPELLVDCLKVMDRAISSREGGGRDMMLSFATGNDNEQSLLKYLVGQAAVIQEFSRYSVAYKKAPTA